MSAKYFRTPHVPWSVGGTADDKKVAGVGHLLGKRIRVSEKLDGENSTLTREGVFARSHDGPPVHPSNDWIKSRWAERRHLISPGLSVFVENVFALHSIWYARMAAERQYLHVIGVRDDSTGVHWSTEEVDMMAEELGLPVAPVIFDGVVNTEEELQRIMPGDGRAPSAWRGIPVKMVGREPVICAGYTADSNIREGEVVRVCNSFKMPDATDEDADFSVSPIMKAVRSGHVQTDEHWKRNWRPMHSWLP